MTDYIKNTNILKNRLILDQMMILWSLAITEPEIRGSAEVWSKLTKCAMFLLYIILGKDLKILKFLSKYWFDEASKFFIIFNNLVLRLKDISFCTSMTMFEEVYDHFDIENAASHYMRIGHPDEMRVTVDGEELNGEDYLNQFHPPRSGKILKFLKVFDS